MRFEETAKKIGILALLAAVSASAAACGSENMVKAPVVGTLDPAQGGAAESGTAGAEGAEDVYKRQGFIDLHTHGGGGHDFMDGTAEAVEGACRAHLVHGTTSLCPTTLTMPDIFPSSRL